MLPKRTVQELVRDLRIRARALTGEGWERTATRAMMEEAAQGVGVLEFKIQRRRSLYAGSALRLL